MYVPPEVVAKGGVESLALINSFIRIAENLRKDKNTSKGIADVLSQLETDAFVLAGQFVKEVAGWKSSLRKAGIELDRKFGELEKTTKYWKNRHDKAIEAFAPTLDAFKDKMCSFIDDVIAIARCAGKEEILALSSEEGAQLKEKIRAETDLTTHSVKEVLNGLVRHAERFRGVLGQRVTLPKA